MEMEVGQTEMAPIFGTVILVWDRGDKEQMDG